MEFYKEGRVLGITANTRLDLGAAQFNHKAVMVLSDADCKLEFYTKGAVSAGITFGAGGQTPITNVFTNALIPVRVAAVTPTTGGTGKIILFN
jgi:hypothetical protein